MSNTCLKAISTQDGSNLVQVCELIKKNKSSKAPVFPVWKEKVGRIHSSSFNAGADLAKSVVLLHSEIRLEFFPPFSLLDFEGFFELFIYLFI